MQPTLPADALAPVLARLGAAHAAHARRYPGDRPGRQPVHTVYGGAHLFRADAARKLGDLALRALDAHAPDAPSFARALALPDADVPAARGRHERVYERVRDKLRREPVEDLRVDFEDGYGQRPDDEEDAHALAAGAELARGLAEASLPPFVGIRVKSLSAETAARSLRTLDLALTSLVTAARSSPDAPSPALPPNFVVTLPKVVAPEQVAALVAVLGRLEAALALPAGSVAIELMVEATQALASPRGELALAHLLDAASGRCVAAHFGAYDYTAGCGVAAPDQSLAHPWCDHARHLMLLAFAGTGVRLSDGATTELPIAPHRGPDAGLTDAQREANRAAVHGAWALAHANVTRALAQGYWQGWDLHPAQLPARYAAVYGYVLGRVDAAGARLRGFVERAARATRAGATFDDAATGQGLVNFFLRAVDSGALTETEASAHAGAPVELLRTRSFARIAGAGA